MADAHEAAHNMKDGSIDDAAQAMDCKQPETLCTSEMTRDTLTETDSKSKSTLQNAKRPISPETEELTVLHDTCESHHVKTPSQPDSSCFPTEMCAETESPPLSSISGELKGKEETLPLLQTPNDAQTQSPESCRGDVAIAEAAQTHQTDFPILTQSAETFVTSMNDGTEGSKAVVAAPLAAVESPHPEVAFHTIVRETLEDERSHLEMLKGVLEDVHAAEKARYEEEGTLSPDTSYTSSSQSMTHPLLDDGWGDRKGGAFVGAEGLGAPPLQSEQTNVCGRGGRVRMTYSRITESVVQSAWGKMNIMYDMLWDKTQRRLRAMQTKEKEKVSCHQDGVLSTCVRNEKVRRPKTEKPSRETHANRPFLVCTVVSTRPLSANPQTPTQRHENTTHTPSHEVSASALKAVDEATPKAAPKEKSICTSQEVTPNASVEPLEPQKLPKMEVHGERDGSRSNSFVQTLRAKVGAGDEMEAVPVKSAPCVRCDGAVSPSPRSDPIARTHSPKPAATEVSNAEGVAGALENTALPTLPLYNAVTSKLVTERHYLEKIESVLQDLHDAGMRRSRSSTVAAEVEESHSAEHIPSVSTKTDTVVVDDAVELNRETSPPVDAENKSITKEEDSTNLPEESTRTNPAVCSSCEVSDAHNVSMEELRVELEHLLMVNAVNEKRIKKIRLLLQEGAGEVV